MNLLHIWIRLFNSPTIIATEASQVSLSQSQPLKLKSTESQPLKSKSTESPWCKLYYKHKEINVFDHSDSPILSDNPIYEALDSLGGNKMMLLLGCTLNLWAIG